MKPDDLVQIRHMLDTARTAIGFVYGRSRDDLDHDRQLAYGGFVSLIDARSLAV